MPNLSILIPVYNSRDYLKTCLDSILEQRNLTFEIIIVNDGSNDGSDQILDSYALKDSRIKVYNQENRGRPFARNKCLEFATGEYILFVDSDDYIQPNSLHVLLNSAKQNNVDLLQSEVVQIDACNRRRKLTLYPVPKPIKGIDYFNLMIHKRTIRLAPYFNLVRREFILSLPFLFDEELTRMQDFEYYPKVLIKAQSVMNVQFPYYFFQSDSNTNSQSERADIVRSFQLYATVLSNFQEFSEVENLSKETKDKLSWLVCSHVSNYSYPTLMRLPDEARRKWKSFILANLFRNGGWLRPYIYKRYFQLRKL